MLNYDGSISFTEEVMALVDAFLDEYEETKGAPCSHLDRGLVISYILGAILCDLEIIWEALGSSPIFGRHDPRAIYEECVRRNAERTGVRREIEAELVRRGWVPPSEQGEGAPPEGDGNREEEDMPAEGEPNQDED